MGRVECYRIRSLLVRGGSDLAPGQRLQVELHRTACERCQADATFDQSLRQLAEPLPPPLRPSAIERVIERSLDAPSQAAQHRRSASTRWWGLGVGVTAAAAAAIALYIGLASDESNDAEQVAAPEQSGSAEQNEPPEPAQQPPAELMPGDQVVLAHAEVVATAAATIRWTAESRELVLSSGALRVRVTPGTGRSFTVLGPHFVVDVVGTEFDVDADSVTVARGLVTIRSLDGAVLRERLTAGEKYTYPGDQPESSAGGADEDVEPDIPAKDLIARATEQIQQGKLSKARGSLRKALEAAPTRSQRAEATTLRAEIAVLDGDAAEAIRLYRRVASRYRRTSQAQAALFAAARLEARRGRSSAAEKLLLQYRDRYPRGRFAREVDTMLERITPK